jgi:hypothetical protein
MFNLGTSTSTLDEFPGGGAITGLVVVISIWFVFSILHHFGVVNIEEALNPPTISSGGAVFLSRSYFSYLRSAEREVGLLLHDLAEETRAGASLPVATSRVLRRAHHFPSIRASLSQFDGLLRLGYTPVEAQKRVTHPSWLVRLCFALLSVSSETGAAFDLLERLSSSFRRIYDAKRALASSIIPLFLLGVSVPVISATAVWFLGSLAVAGASVPGLGATSEPSEVEFSISAASILSGLIVSKAYTLSVRSLTALPAILFATLASVLFFGLR